MAKIGTVFSCMYLNRFSIFKVERINETKNIRISAKNKVRELLARCPGLADYHLVLLTLFENFYLEDAQINIDSERLNSRLSQSKNQTVSREFLLIVGIKNRERTIDIIWSILHEFGHLQQDRPTELEQANGTIEKYNREVRAWNIAENKFLEFNILQPFLADFKSYRLTGQESYNPAR